MTPCKKVRAAEQWLAPGCCLAAGVTTNGHMMCVCRFAGWSRFWALAELKPDIEEARAIAVARGAVRAASLPRSCAHLRHVEELPKVCHARPGLAGVVVFLVSVGYSTPSTLNPGLD